MYRNKQREEMAGPPMGMKPMRKMSKKRGGRKKIGAGRM
jgi:hypothetical protein